MAPPSTLLICFLLLSACCSDVQVLGANRWRHSGRYRRASLRPLNASAIIQPSGPIADASKSSSIKFFGSGQTSTVSTEPPASTETRFNTSNPKNSLNGTQDSLLNVTVVDDLQILVQRRIVDIINNLDHPTQPLKISAWFASFNFSTSDCYLRVIHYRLSTLGPNGQWPPTEVNYTTGCDARRANWPASQHWLRIVTMSAAWHGGLSGADQYVNSSTLRTAISSAINYWFSNDLTNVACLDQGGLPPCPCGTPGLWNTNWYSNIILVPGLVGQTCLLLDGSLTTAEIEGCTRITLRAFGTFDNFKNGTGILTGSNVLDVARIGLDQGLFSQNDTLVADAYDRVHKEVVIQQNERADGIRPDGSFGQHAGLLYNGNYGKVYVNDDLDLELEAGGTQFEAGQASRDALATVLDGSAWMMYRNVATGMLHWDFSVLGRFITFPVLDAQPTASIDLNLTEIHQLGVEWNSNTLTRIADALQQNTTDANIGGLCGSRMFYTNDYFVRRGSGYVTTVKMYSTRTKSAESTNSENPFGFHLSDGTVYTYLEGNEYEDIAAAWDWNLIPGTTTDYAATPLDCGDTGWNGTEQFVGGVSATPIGIAVMRYSNPFTYSLSWQKAWFFLEDDVQVVMVNNLWSNSSAPLYSVLDQRRHSGDVYVNGKPVTISTNYTSAHSLWHGGVGYTFVDFPGVSCLSVQVGDRFGNWSLIGVSTQPPETVDLFAAYLTHSALRTPISYTIFPSTKSPGAFEQKNKQTRLRTLWNDAHVSALFDDVHQTAMVVFWDYWGGSVVVPGSSFFDAPLTISASGNSAVLYQLNTGNVTVSDPSQNLSELDITFAVGLLGRKPPHWGWEFYHDLSFDLPTNGLAGSSVSKTIFR